MELTALQKEKYEKLKNQLSAMKSVAVAFSGGVDSTFLLKTAHDVLGDHCVAVTARSLSFPERERKEAQEFCEKEGIRQIICESEELSIDGFAKNPPNRCYICKKELFGKMKALAEKEGLTFIVEGSNLDDEGDYRPGLLAVKELGIASPLRTAGLYKADIRAISEMLGLSTYNKPSFACLSSRFVYGETITPQKLHMVDVAEQILFDLGCVQARVRIHGNLARIEVLTEDFPIILEENNRARITAELQKLGFTYITMDLTGYHTGSMNKTLPE